MKKTLSAKQTAWLLAVVYFSSYVTRINFAAIIQEVTTATGFAKTSLSVILVCLSITYGAGQIINGFVGDKVKPQYMILCGLSLSSLINLIFPFCAASIPAMCVLWGINGFSQAMMWPPIVQILVRTTSGALYNSAMVIVSCGSSVGTILIYLSAPLLISAFGWTGVFFVCSGIGLAAMLLFFFLQRYIHLPPIKKEEPIPVADKEKALPKKEEKPTFRFPREALFPILFIGLGIILQGMLRDGISTWMPSYLVDVFGFENGSSILTTVLLAVFSMISFYLVSWIYHTFFQNEVTCAVWIYAAAILCATVLFFFHDAHAVLSIVLLMLLTACAHGVNLMLISHVPKRFRKYGNISTISGCVNACTYAGAAVSTYGIALLVEKMGWRFTIGSWILIAALGLLACFIAVRPWRKFFKKPADEEIGYDA